MEKEFDTLPVRTLVFRLGIPAMAAQFFNILYSVVDRIFVGHMINGERSSWKKKENDCRNVYRSWKN